MKLKNRLPLCYGPIALCLCDVIATLAGQPAAYWGGDYARVIEGNPLPKWLLSQSPGLFVGSIVLWILVFSVAIIRLPTRTARPLAFVVMIGHALGASTWLIRLPFGLVWVLILFLAAKYFDRFLRDEP